MFQKLKSVAPLIFLAFLKPTIVFGDELKCVRTSNSANGWRSSSIFNEVWPKELNLSFTIFEEAGGSSEALVHEIEYDNGNKRVVRLLPNKKMIGSFVVPSGYVKPADTRYKCDLSSNEVRQALATGDENGKVAETEGTPDNPEKELYAAKGGCNSQSTDCLNISDFEISLSRLPAGAEKQLFFFVSKNRFPKTYFTPNKVN